MEAKDPLTSCALKLTLHDRPLPDVVEVTVEDKDGNERTYALNSPTHLGAGAPWADFLHYRAICIDWMMSEGKSPEEIARALSMDGPDQVRLIAARKR